MGLEIPDLDDKQFDELIEDARKRIPVYSDEWTDHNLHDPGITILEMLAWLVETYIYQLNRATDEHVRKYLKLMGISPRPPSPASLHLKLRPPAESAGVRLPAGEPLHPESDSSSELAFETVESLTLNEAQLERVISQHHRGRTDNSSANSTVGLDFLAFGETAEEGSAMYLGFDGDPFETAERLELFVSEHDEDLPDPGSHADEPSTFESTVVLSWEYLENYSHWYRDEAWTKLYVHIDETNQFYRSGRVQLAKPDGSRKPESHSGVMNQKADLSWIRCVVRTPGFEIPPRIESIHLNVVEARHRRAVEEKRLHRPNSDDKTTAHSGQIFEFAHSPVLDSTQTEEAPESGVEHPRIVIRHDDGTVSAPWKHVPDFDSSDPDDEHYVLDHAAGLLRFGDGVRGKVPEPGHAVVAESYVYGGGSRGNVPKISEWTFENSTPLGVGIYKYHCDRHSSEGMRGAIVVDTSPKEDDGTSEEPNYGNWFTDENTVETENKRNEGLVTIEVGNDGNQFSPAAIRVDPGTVIEFVWKSDGHSITVVDQPHGGGWIGHPVVEDEGFTYTYTFNVVRPHEIEGTSRVPATSGRDAESVEAALDRLQQDLQTPHRAVTADDYQALAMNTPGLRVGRAKAIIGSDANDERSENHAGARVVVVPHSRGSSSGWPMPSEGFLNAVRTHLEQHRLLTDRVTVDPPTYVGIGMGAELQIKPGYSHETVPTEVKAALEEFLDPLEGFRGEGWPFGRPVYKSEIYEVIEAQSGIAGVPKLRLTVQRHGRLDSDGNVLLGPASLPFSVDHDVTVNTGQSGSRRGL